MDSPPEFICRQENVDLSLNPPCVDLVSHCPVSGSDCRTTMNFYKNSNSCCIGVKH
uniref:MAPK3 n=1 Tax=Aquilaria malaccensis TaxID=223753 RepID=A0A4Y6GP12_9ROSI|nr:MAPK3 [Aquilaria malaccensis]